MYNWWLTSFVVFTSIFWGVEVIFTVAFWLCFSMLLSSKNEPSAKKEPNQKTNIKREAEDGPEENNADVKEEEGEPLLHDYPAATEADVEDEDEPDLPVVVGGSHIGAPSDSGLGTSMESSATKRDTVRRRASKPGLDE
jgi:seipin